MCGALADSRGVAEMQAQWKADGQAGLQILRAILENEVTHRVDLPEPKPTAAVCAGKAAWLCPSLLDRSPAGRPGVQRAKARKWS